jgi:hypothetical protein
MKSSHYLGAICVKHPEANGLRSITYNKCVPCMNARSSQASRKKSKTWTPEAQLARAVYFRVKKKQRTYELMCRVPPWADKVKISAIYAQASLLGLEVDHIIPLNGALVSGLHVHNNLQLLTPEANRAKSNYYVP